MRKSIFFCCTVLACLQASSQEHSVLMPAPSRITYFTGRLPLETLSVYAGRDAGKEVLFALQELKRGLESRTGIRLKNAATAARASVRIHLEQRAGALPGARGGEGIRGREDYKINIDKTGISIKAVSSAGLFYAVQTLKQLVETAGSTAWLPFAAIEDSPAIACRGVMMDFAHGALLRVEEIKRQIDFLAQWKINQYYFYNEVSIAFTGHEGLNYQQAYSQADIREIVAYARARHMDLIPFVAFYGHLHDLLKKETYASLAIGRYGHELDPRNAAVMLLLKDWIKQYAAIFPSPYMHVGFDETWETNRLAEESDTTIHAEQLWLQHLTAVSEELAKYGKTVMAWTDMTTYYPRLMQAFPAGAIPVVWEYSPDTAALRNYMAPVLKAGKKFFIQPAVSGWGHVYPAAAYSYANMDLCLKTGLREGAPGYINSVWTDAVEPFVRPSWMFMAYGCIGAWQGFSPDTTTYEQAYWNLVYPGVGTELQQASRDLAESVQWLQACLGNNTANMPGGTIIESWSNPFDPYYLAITRTKAAALKMVRLKTESAETLLVRAMAKRNQQDNSFLESLRVTARLLHYEASRFLWARTICDRWDEAMLEKKKNSFVFYDIGYLCHGLIQDMMDELGSLKEDYARSWLSESKPYRLNTILGRFDVEYGLWQKLLLKTIDNRIRHAPAEVSSKSFVELFKPDF